MAQNRLHFVTGFWHRLGDNGDTTRTDQEQIEQVCHQCHQPKTRLVVCHARFYKGIQPLKKFVTSCPCARGVEIEQPFSLFSILFASLSRARARASGDKVSARRPALAAGRPWRAKGAAGPPPATSGAFGSPSTTPKAPIFASVRWLADHYATYATIINRPVRSAERNNEAVTHEHHHESQS